MATDFRAIPEERAGIISMTMDMAAMAVIMAVSKEKDMIVAPILQLPNDIISFVVFHQIAAVDEYVIVTRLVTEDADGQLPERVLIDPFGYRWCLMVPRKANDGGHPGATSMLAQGIVDLIMEIPGMRAE